MAPRAQILVFVAVNGDPIADISELTRVSLAMKGGTIYNIDICNL